MPPWYVLFGCVCVGWVLGVAVAGWQFRRWIAKEEAELMKENEELERQRRTYLRA